MSFILSANVNIFQIIGFGQVAKMWRADNENRYTSCSNPGPTGLINALSADGPWYISSTGRTTAPPSVASWSGNLSATVAQLNMTQEQCSYITNTSSADLRTWCECTAKADVFHNLDSLRYSYFTTGFFFGLWAFISLLICVCVVKERSQMKGCKALPSPKPLVPSILNTFNNRPFSILLPSWVLDSLANAIISSLLTFFVRYVVKPEYSNQELWGCRPQGGASDFRCSSTSVLGASVVALLFGALIFTPVWLLLAKKLGKRNAWLLWSFLNGVTSLN